MTEVIKVKDCGDNIGDSEILIHNAIIISRGATNGDIIKAVFPDSEVNGHLTYFGLHGMDMKIYTGKHRCFKLWFPYGWWNVPYKAESEDWE